ncbi:MAG: glutamate--cysteine ligase, partial [Microvirga sp.]
ALKARIAGRSAQDVARDALALSRAGLQRRAHLDEAGRDETQHLTYAEEIVASGRTQAERLLELYHGSWGGSVLPAFRECVF